MKRINIFIFISVIFSCQSEVEDCYQTEYYPTGNLKAIECYNNVLKLRNRREYFENGRLAMNFFVNSKDKIEGSFRSYHENGNLKTKSQLSNGLVNGIQYDYHKTGEIEAITNLKRNMVNGYQIFYHPNGNIRTKFFKVDDYLVYEKRIRQDSINNKKIYTENYFPIVSLSKNPVFVDDTVDVHFEVPLPNDSFNLKNFDVYFTTLPDIDKQEEKTYIDPSWLIKIPIINNKANTKIIIQKSGKLKIVGLLAQKVQNKKIEYDFFTYKFISEPSPGQQN